jgi:hypothetical protein
VKRAFFGVFRFFRLKNGSQPVWVWWRCGVWRALSGLVAVVVVVDPGRRFALPWAAVGRPVGARGGGD